MNCGDSAKAALSHWKKVCTENGRTHPATLENHVLGRFNAVTKAIKERDQASCAARTGLQLGAYVLLTVGYIIIVCYTTAWLLMWCLVLFMLHLLAGIFFCHSESSEQLRKEAHAHRVALPDEEAYEAVGEGVETLRWKKLTPLERRADQERREKIEADKQAEVRKEAEAAEHARREAEARKAEQCDAEEQERHRVERQGAMEAAQHQIDSTQVLIGIQEGGAFGVSLEQLLLHVLQSAGQPHRLLGLPANAPSRLYRERYKAFASRVHPDKIPKHVEHLRPQAEEAFKVLHDAFEALSKQSQR